LLENNSEKAIDSEYVEKGRLNLAKQLCILLSSAFFIMSVIEFPGSMRNFITYAVCCLIPLSMYYLLIKTGRYKLIYTIICTVGTVIAAYTLNFFIDEVHYGEIMWMVLIILLAFWGLSIKAGLVFLVLNLLTLCYYFIFSAKTNLTSLREMNSMALLSLAVEMTVAMTAITFIIIQFVRTYEHSFKRISEASNAINIKNKENELLLKEVHHRVKNNLQIIVSLLRLQKHSKNEVDGNSFDEAINRIMTMSIIHKKLYQSEDLTQINLKSYLQELIEEIENSFESLIHVDVTIDVNVNSVGLKTIVPLGLMINELISNSYKHAFKDYTKAEIRIELNSVSNSEFEMNYSDSGVWTNSKAESTGFGLDLIDTLCHQLEGTFSRENSKYFFRLKNLDIN